MSAPVEVVFTPWPYDAVARGAALLDEKVPGWRKRTDLDRLTRDTDDDILTLHFGTYMDGCWELGLSTTEGRGYGFDIPGGFDSPDAMSRWDALTDAWREAIAGGAS